MSQSHARFAFPWGSPSREKGGALFWTCEYLYNIQYYQVYAASGRDQGEGCGSHFSGVGDPLKTGPASNSVVMCGYQCPGPRNGPALGYQID